MKSITKRNDSQKRAALSVIRPEAPGNGKTIKSALGDFFDETGIMGECIFVESVLDILQEMSSGENTLDAIQPETARALLDKARLTMREVRERMDGIDAYLEKALGASK